MSEQSVSRVVNKVFAGKPLLALSLVLAILLTRINYNEHFGSVLTPPDATLAVFFLAGLWLPSAALFGILLGVSALADQVAFLSGVSDWCVTAAYACLVPAYGCLWIAGRYCRGVEFLSAVGALKLFGSLAIACGVEFVISSGSFFLFSGYFPTMSASEYIAKTAHYFPSYLKWAVVYVVIAISIALVLRAFRPEIVASKDIRQH